MLTVDVTDDPITNYGFTTYTEAEAGYPGAPFGALTPAQFQSFEVLYFAWGPDPSPATFTFYIWTRLGLGEVDPPPEEAFTFTSVAFTDDDDTTWTFTKARRTTPPGSGSPSAATSCASGSGRVSVVCPPSQTASTTRSRCSDGTRHRGRQRESRLHQLRQRH